MNTHRKSSIIGPSSKNRIIIKNLQPVPIIKGSENKKPVIRKDAEGVLIDSKEKMHKISFKSELCEVNIVDNWKELNAEGNENTTSCKCRVF